MRPDAEVERGHNLLTFLLGVQQRLSCHHRVNTAMRSDGVCSLYERMVEPNRLNKGQVLHAHGVAAR